MKYLIICRTEWGFYHYFYCNKKLSDAEFKNIVREKYPEEICDDEIYIHIEKYINLEEIENINL